MSRPDPIQYAERLYAAIRAANFSPISFLAFGNAVKDGVDLRRMPRIAAEPFMRVVGEMLDLEEDAARTGDIVDAEVVVRGARTSTGRSRRINLSSSRESSRWKVLPHGNHDIAARSDCPTPTSTAQPRSPLRDEGPIADSKPENPAPPLAGTTATWKRSGHRSAVSAALCSPRAGSKGGPRCATR